MTPLLVGLAVFAIISPGMARAAEPANGAPQLRISVNGFSRGFTNADMQGLIARGVEAALADDRVPSTQWFFAVQAVPGNRPKTQIVATLQSGSARKVSGFFTSPTLGTTPPNLFVEEIRDFAKRLLRRSDLG